MAWLSRRGEEKRDEEERCWKEGAKGEKEEGKEGMIKKGE